MGFGRDQAERALALTRYNSEIAVHILLSGQPLEVLERRLPGGGGRQPTGDDDDDEGDEDMADDQAMPAFPPAGNPFGGGNPFGQGGGLGQMLGQMMGMGQQPQMAPGNPEYDNLPPALQELARSPHLPVLQLLIRLNPTLSQQVISTIQTHHPDVIAAANQHPEAFARLLGADPAQIGNLPFAQQQQSSSDPNLSSSGAPAPSHSEQSQHSSGYASAVPPSGGTAESFQTPNANPVSDTPMNDGSEATSAVPDFAGASPAVPAAAPAANPLQNPVQQAGGHMHVQLTDDDNEALETLTAMGFSREKCVEAWLACERNLERAANYLMETMDQGM